MPSRLPAWHASPVGCLPNQCIMQAAEMLVVPSSAMQAAMHAAVHATSIGAASPIATAMQAAVKAARRAWLAARQPSAPQISLQEVKGSASIQALWHWHLAVHLLCPMAQCSQTFILCQHHLQLAAFIACLAGCTAALLRRKPRFRKSKDLPRLSPLALQPRCTSPLIQKGCSDISVSMQALPM